MRKQFKPVIKHDVVTQTYTIRDKKGVVIQVPDVIIDESDNYYKAERDTLIDDIAVLKANISRLERENHDLKKRNALLMNTVDDLDKENKALRLQANTYFDEWQNVKNLYTTLTNHIRMKAENNPGVSRYIDLVNYIDRLERGDGEKI